MTASKLRIPISHSIFTYGAKLSSKYHDAWGTTFLNNSAFNQYSEAGLNEALMKKKKTTTHTTNKDKRMVKLSITKVREAQLGLDLNQFLGQTQTY